mmetsp:Transcript_3938/g.10386  ORF Transcript_3938/g.10386 Transcript_3938/m.10386 type:complete len:211 (+) Transcript_3938:58-690(+)
MVRQHAFLVRACGVLPQQYLVPIFHKTRVTVNLKSELLAHPQRMCDPPRVARSVSLRVVLVHLANVTAKFSGKARMSRCVTVRFQALLLFLQLPLVLHALFQELFLCVQVPTLPTNHLRLILNLRREAIHTQIRARHLSLRLGGCCIVPAYASKHTSGIGGIAKSTRKRSNPLRISVACHRKENARVVCCIHLHARLCSSSGGVAQTLHG